MLAEEFPDMNARGAIQSVTPWSDFIPLSNTSILRLKKRSRQDAKTLNQAASDYQRSCRETMRRKATGCMSQEMDIMRRSCLAKLPRVKAPHIEIGNPASRKPFAV